jgi:hypothetical protein
VLPRDCHGALVPRQPAERDYLAPSRKKSSAGQRNASRREDAERFIEEVRGDEPELARHLRIGERELKAGSRN